MVSIPHPFGSIPLLSKQTRLSLVRETGVVSRTVQYKYNAVIWSIECGLLGGRYSLELRIVLLSTVSNLLLVI
ncbi:hypothetical protein AKJ16_DCAP01045 [Drosera capensis]